MEREVPEGWEKVRILEVLENPRNSISTGELSKHQVLYFSIPEFDESGKPQLVPGSEIGSSKYEVPTDCVLLSRLNPRIPRIWRVEHSDEHIAACSTEFWPLIPKSGAVELDFLKFFLESREFRADPRIAPASSTRSHQRIKRKPFKKFSFPLPPLPEQKKIAAILASVDEAIEATEAVIEQTRRVKKGLLEELLTRGIGHTSFKETKIGEIPEAWEVNRLKSVAEIRTGIAKNSNKKRDHPVKRPYLRVANVQDGYLDLSEIKHVTVEKERVSRYLLESGDVLMTEGGDIDKLGRGYIWKGELVLTAGSTWVVPARTGRRGQGAVTSRCLSIVEEPQHRHRRSAPPRAPA